jgi:hypothetical protein
LECVGGFFIKVKGSYEKFWFIFRAGSTKLDKRINPIALPGTFKVFFDPI